MPVEVKPELTIVWPTACPYKLEPCRKRLCIDLDGVICEYDFPEIVKNFFGVDLPSKPIYAYDLADVLGVAPIHINAMFQEQVYGKPNLVVGAVETLKDWKSKGYNLVIYSNRVKYMGVSSLGKWLIDWQIPFNDIDGGNGKYDIHIDDSPAKLMATDSRIKLLYNQPWNEGCFDLTKSLVRVKNWKEVKDHVHSLLEN